MPHRLRITNATLDAKGAEKLEAGQRVSVWATQKRRGKKGAREGCKVLIGVLVAGKIETQHCCLDIEKGTLVSFTIAPARSCSVHLSGFFDSRFDRDENEGEGRQLTWDEIKTLMCAQAAETGEEMGFVSGSVQDHS